MIMDGTKRVSPDSKRCGRAFTLVELLVVITIIATLAALLIPALSMAKDRANSATCVNNVRQIGAALNSFLDDNNQWYPYISPNGCGVVGFMWHRQLGPYVGGTNNVAAARLFYCPSNPWKLPMTATLAQNSPTLYGLNACIIPGSWNSVSSSGSCPTNNSLDMWSRTKPSDLLYPGTVMLTGESPYSNSWTESPYGLILPDGSISNLPFDWPGYASYWQTDWLALRCLGNCHPQAIVNHNLAWNSLMGDGHVRLVTKMEMVKEGGTAQNGGFSPLFNSGYFRKPSTYLNCPVP